MVRPSPTFNKRLCADMVVITAEEIVDDAILRREPERNLIPPFAVTYVCHVPFGAHPYAVYNCYDYDPRQLKLYHDSAEDDEAYRQVSGKIRLRGEEPCRVPGSGRRLGAPG